MSVGAVNKQTGDRIPTAGMPAIDDALDLTSVNPVQNAIVTAALANKQNATDNSLQTTDKTVVGAINEHEGDISSLKSGLTNVQDDVKLNTNDLTTPSRTKNLLPMIVEEIKALNTSGTWSGNAYTLNGVTYTVNSDSAGAVTDIATSGTSSARSDFIVYSTNTDFNKYNGCILTGCPVGGAALNYRMVFSSSDASQLFYDIGSGTSLTGITKTSGICAITTYGTGLDMSGKIFKPMIRLASVTDTTFAPYIPSVESRIEAVESGLTDNSFDITTNECFDIILQGSHYITNKVAHICCLVKANSVPEASNITIAGLPSGMVIAQEGMIFPIYKSIGRWEQLSSIVYGYVSNTSIVARKNDIVVDNYYYVDFIAHLVE